MTNLKDVHLRLDKESKAQWIEVVELMGETMQSQAFRRLVQQKYNEIKQNSTEDE
jgi:predicted DNA-binding protein (MmcQ/YjbR family)